MYNGLYLILSKVRLSRWKACSCKHAKRRHMQTYADTCRHTQTNADEHKANSVGKCNLKMRPDIRRLFNDFRDTLYVWWFYLCKANTVSFKTMYVVSVIQ